MLERSCGVGNAVIPKWPGYHYTLGQFQHSTILALPELSSFLWLLIERKTFLGEKIPVAVSIFTARGRTDDRTPSFIFASENADANQWQYAVAHYYDFAEQGIKYGIIEDKEYLDREA